MTTTVSGTADLESAVAAPMSVSALVVALELLLVVGILFCNIRTERAFDEERMLLLRSLVGVVAVLAFASGWWSSVRAATPRWSRQPLVIVVGLTLTAQLLSALFGWAPRVSLLGGYLSRQGVYSELSYVLFAALVVLAAAASESRQRLVVVLSITSLVAAVYGLIQYRGLDPLSIDWTFVEGRIGSLFGHPVFFAAFLAMVMPITLAQSLSPAVAGSPSSRWHAALLACQAAALLVTASRGPVLGAVLGLWLVLVAAKRHLPRRRRLLIPVIVVGSLLVMLGGLDRSEPSSLDGSPLTRYLHLPSVTGASDATRLDLWQGMLALAQRDPRRLLLGYGSETLPYTFPQVAPPALRWQSPHVIAPSRSHSQFLDELIHHGLIGVIGGHLVLLLALGYLLQRLGLLENHGWRLAVLCLSGGAVLVVSLALQRLPVAVIPAALGLGVVVGGISFLHLSPATGNPGWHADHLLAMGVLGGLVAHYVEIQVSFPTTTTRLLYWLYVALAFSLRRTDLSVDRHPVPATPAEPGMHGGQGSGLVAGYLLTVLLFGFATKDFRWHGATVALPGLLVLAWLASRLFCGAAWVDGLRLPWRSSSSTAALVITWYLGLGFCWRILGGYLLSADLVEVTFFTLWSAGLASFVLLRSRWPAVEARWRHRVAVAALALPIAGLTTVNLRDSSADTAFLAGKLSQRDGDLAGALAHLERAVALTPYRSTYRLRLGDARLAHGRTLPHPPEMERSLQDYAGHPLALLDGEVVVRLARAERDLATVAIGDQKDLWRTRSDEHYATALALRPTDVSLWNELSSVALSEGRSQAAASYLGRSVELAPEYAETQILVGNERLRSDEVPAALTAFAAAIAAAPDDVRAWRGLSYAQARLGALPEAIAAGERAVLLEPWNWSGRFNLSLVLGQNRQFRPALGEAQRALQYAVPDQRFTVERLVARLSSEVNEAATCSRDQRFE